jgi:carboxyl-terminal processing protease
VLPKAESPSASLLARRAKNHNIVISTSFFEDCWIIFESGIQGGSENFIPGGDMGKLRKFFLTGLVLTFGLVSKAGANEKPAEEYWDATNLSEGSLRTLIESVNCSDAVHLLPCLTALDTIAELSKDEILLITDEQWTTFRELYGETVHQFGPLRAVRRATPNATKLTPAEDLSAHHRGLQVQTDSLKHLVANGTVNQISWKDVEAYVFSLPPGKRLSAKAAIAESLNNYVGALYDPHTHFITQAKIADDMSGEENSFTGIGAKVSAAGGVVSFLDPIEGSPAEAAKIQAGDRPVEVNGVSVEGRSLEEVVSLIRGPEGTMVHLKVVRTGQATPLEFQIVRAVIETPNVSDHLIWQPNGRFGYIKINQFADNLTCEQVAEALTRFREQNVKGYILDLRGNPGGMIVQAVCIGALFIGPNLPIVSTVEIDRENPGKTKGNPNTYTGFLEGGMMSVKQSEDMQSLVFAPVIHELPMTQLPTLVLVDSGSASASEIVAGALQDYGAHAGLPFWIAGDRSYGKGSFQGESPVSEAPELKPIAKDLEGIAFFFTKGRFYQPFGGTNQIRGILPDFPIAAKPHSNDNDEDYWREEDEYTNALPPEGTPWTEARPAEVRAAQACANAQSASSEATYQAEMTKKGSSDYRLLVAGDLLSCLVQAAPH